MLMLIFTYHQVMPAFLDFLFPFGRQEYQKDFHSCGFRHDTCISEFDGGLKIPELGRSGREFQICYSLKSVEPSKDRWPWSIRQCALYHSFDLETGRSNWIVVKGDQKMKNRIKAVVDSQWYAKTSPFQNVERAFVSTLKIHMIILDWSAENWRWFINFLEEDLQSLSRSTLTEPVENSSSLIAKEPVNQRIHFSHVELKSSISHSDVDFDKNKTASKCSNRLARKLRIRTGLSSHASERTLPPQSCFRDQFSAHPFSPPMTPPATPFSPPFSPDLPSRPEVTPDSGCEEGFSFENLQKIQFLEEKANETHLVLKTNISVLLEFKKYYQSIMDSEDWPQDLKARCRRDVLQYESRLNTVSNDHQMQQERIERLLCLLANRKNLVRQTQAQITRSG